MKKIAVLVSGSGTNLQAIIDAVEAKEIDASIEIVISDRKEVFALERAKNHGIEARVITDEDEMIKVLQDKKIDLVVLAGYLKILGKRFIFLFEDRVINIHPSLIPAFCGKGYYGLKVHEAAIKYGVKLSGATVHFVDENADTGPIIMQESIEVEEKDTPQTLQKKILENIEHKILVESIKAICENRVKIKGRKVIIK